MQCDNLDPSIYSPRAIEGLALFRATVKVADLARRRELMLELAKLYPELDEVPRECLPEIPVGESSPSVPKKKKSLKPVLIGAALLILVLVVTNLTNN